MGSVRAADAVNEVRLVGRVSAVEELRRLPSGDVVVTLRVVVPRSRPRPGARVDTIDVACWSTATRRRAGRLGAGDEVEVVGALRRRFFRSAAGPASRYEVEATGLRRRGGGSRRAGPGC